MPQRRAINSRSVTTPVNVLQQHGTARGAVDRSMPKPTTCIAPVCNGEPAGEDMPVVLCPKHLRETYQYAQGVIEDRLIHAATSIM